MKTQLTFRVDVVSVSGAGKGANTQIETTHSSSFTFAAAAAAEEASELTANILDSSDSMTGVAGPGSALHVLHKGAQRVSPLASHSYCGGSCAAAHPQLFEQLKFM